MFRHGSSRFSRRQSTAAPQAGYVGRVASKPIPSGRAALRVRGRGQTNSRQPFMPPETWYEPREAGTGYRVIVQPAGDGFRHVVTPEEIRARLAQLPAEFVRPLHVVQLSQMTRKKRGLPLYGMQWGSAVYLYPLDASLTETYDTPPKPMQITEARMYGGRWEQRGPRQWALVWTAETIKDFYLNNILIHELGHVLDRRNTRSLDRERFAEWFAVEYGYRRTQAARRAARWGRDPSSDCPTVG